MQITRRSFVAGSLSVLVLACSEGDGEGGVGDGAAIPAPSSWEITHWATDELAFGSYSFLAVGSEPADRERLAAPVGDRLFFAGEATSSDHPATVHGALLSGIRAAEEVLESMTSEDESVVVIGAGVAGLACARTLAEAGVDVTVVEARDRPFGRIHTTEGLEGLTVDLGASWIHGTEGNPLTDLAAEAGVETFETDYEDVTAYTADGDEVSEDDFIGEDELVELATSAGDATSLGEVFAAVLAELDADDAAMARLSLTYNLENELAADIDDLAPAATQEGSTFGGPDVLFPGGFRALFEAAADELDIVLDTPVSSISLAGDGVVLDGATGSVEADRVVVTASLGVLQQDRIAFDPPLPADKRAAIDALGMGVLDKIYLRFPTQFWDDSQVILFQGKAPGQFNVWFNMTPAVGAPVLLAFHTGRNANRLEPFSDEDIVAEAMTALRTMYA